MEKAWILLVSLFVGQMLGAQRVTNSSPPIDPVRLEIARQALCRANDAVSALESNNTGLLKISLAMNDACETLGRAGTSQQAISVAFQTVRATRELIDATNLTSNHRLVGTAISVDDVLATLDLAERWLSEVTVPFEEKASSAESCRPETVKIFYATDRKPTPSAPLDFGGDTGRGELSLGIFAVTVASDHKIGSTDTFTITSRSPQGPQDFYRSLSDAMKIHGTSKGFVFIHGFDVKFDDAVIRTAQIAYDLGFCGAAVLYSWPSQGGIPGLIRYSADRDKNEWTEQHLQRFLEQLGTLPEASSISILAHSLGNRALMNAVRAVANPQGAKFNHLVLAAPDVRKETFVQRAPALKALSHDVTLYVSSSDFALFVSKILNKGARAGDSSPEKEIVVVDGIDTIDVSAISTDLTGHSYYGNNRALLNDMSYLFSGIPTNSRFALQPTGQGPKKHWKFVP
jgi:esterase/lipase superfamily enzyme